jgi:hypothetical protein
VKHIDEQTTRFIDYLHRGGTVDYTWAVRGEQKTSFWRTVGEGTHTLLNSQHNMYFGVHPCITIPPTNSKGKAVEPKYVRSQLPYIAAINCVFGEFDAKKWVEVSLLIFVRGEHDGTHDEDTRGFTIVVLR